MEGESIYLQGTPIIPRKATFLQRSASVASLVAWKARFEAFSGKFAKNPSFVSYTNDVNEEVEENIQDLADTKCKLAKEQLYIDEGYNTGPENDFPPGYEEVTAETPPPPHPDEQNNFFKQDFSALEAYLKKRLSVKKRKGSKGNGEDAETTEKVFQWLNELPEGDNLEEFLEAYGIPTEGVNLEELKERLRFFLQERLQFERVTHEPQTEENTQEDNQVPASGWENQITRLRDLADGDNLEKWLESLDVPYFQSIPETKKEIRKYLKLQLDETLQPGPPEPPPRVVLPTNEPELKDISSLSPQWKELIEKMRSLKNEDELDKWLDSLEFPCNVPKDKLKVEIKKFFKHEEFETFAGKSVFFQEDSFAKKLWDKFEDASVLKQVAFVAGTTAVMGLLAVLSTTLLSFTFPAGLAAAPYFTEVFAQYFLQRQEIAFNLLNCHAQNAKPLSTAWAKQYVLYKYC